MRLYLSSYRLGNAPQAMVTLLRGGKRVAVIMNAQDAVAPERRAERLQQELDGLRGLGLQPEALDLRDYFGHAEALRDRMQQFDCVWVRGGNVFLLRRAFAQSGFDAVITELLRQDAIVYGGFSAGVCILAPSLRGVELVDPTDALAAGYDGAVIWDGLGLVPYAIAPHYKSDHPESADIDKCVAYFEANDMPYKTLRDGEAIVVNGTEEHLVG